MAAARVLVMRPTAKINLTLRVGPRQANGFHDIRTLFQSVALSDTLTFSTKRGPLTLTCDAPGIPADRTNIVWRAADAVWRAIGRDGEPHGVRITIEKGIPAAAGLGGGSADAAAALIALNRIWDCRLSRADLLRLGASLGSDVPFFFHGGTALGLGRGEELYPVDDIRRLGVVLIKPSFGVSAADAYRWCDDDRAEGATGADVRPSLLDVGWRDGLTIANDLEGAVAKRHPEIGEMIDACRREGALAASMTGSGSVVFALFDESGVRRVARRLERPGWLVVAARTLGRLEAGRRLPGQPRPTGRRQP